MKRHGTWILIFVLAAATAWGMAPPVFAQEKAKGEGAAKEGPGFTVARLVVGTGVENREPTGVAETFPASTEKIYCFLEATNIAKDTEASFVWSLGGKEIWKMSLPLKMGPKWRTKAFKSLRGLKGDWKIEVKDAAGNPVKEVKFKVE
jgi:hypothetical protein